MHSATHAPADRSLAAARQPWQAPTVTDLPRLTELTLATGASIPGDCGVSGSGSTCY